MTRIFRGAFRSAPGGHTKFAIARAFDPLDLDVDEAGRREQSGQCRHSPAGEIASLKVVTGKVVTLVLPFDQGDQEQAPGLENPARLAQGITESDFGEVQVRVTGKGPGEGPVAKRKSLQVPPHERKLTPSSEVQHGCGRVDAHQRRTDLGQISPRATSEVGDQAAADLISKASPEPIGRLTSALDPFAGPALVDSNRFGIHPPKRTTGLVLVSSGSCLIGRSAKHPRESPGPGSTGPACTRPLG